LARRRLRGLRLLLAIAWLAPGAAWAQPPPAPAAEELAAARQLFEEAIRAEDQGRWQEALDTFVRVRAITASPVLHYHIGVCSEHLGRLVEALNAFQMAVQLAEERHAPDVAKEARAEADKLRPRLARIALHVPADAADVTLLLDGRPLSAGVVGASLPIDPGERRIAVRAGNYERVFEATLKLAAGESRTIEVDLGGKKAPEPQATPEPPPPVVAAPPPPAAPTSPPPAPPRSLAPVIWVGGTAVALGIASLATGLAAHADHTEYENENGAKPPTGSLADREALRDAGMTKAVVSTVLTGGALAAGGVTGYLLARYLKAPAAVQGRSHAPAWSAWASRDGAGLVVEGAL
jgi:hypothetical protein